MSTTDAVSKDTDPEPGSVRSAVNYIRNAPVPGGASLEFVTEDESLSTMETLPGYEVWFHDVRGRASDIDREGFVLVPHTSSVVDFDAIEEDQAIDQQYSDEMAELLREVTGASRVLMLGGGKKRYAEREADKLAPLTNAKPARYPHADNTDAASISQAEMIASFLPDLDVGSWSRWALYNMWRCASPPPQDVPLAVCDARTVEPVDEITIVAITMIRGKGEYRHDTVGYRFNPTHRWCYFSEMTRDEVIVFKAYDSDPARAHRVPHTAFDDPSCPPDAPPRASVEMRALALFG